MSLSDIWNANVWFWYFEKLACKGLVLDHLTKSLSYGFMVRNEKYVLLLLCEKYLSDQIIILHMSR